MKLPVTLEMKFTPNSCKVVPYMKLNLQQIVSVPIWIFIQDINRLVNLDTGDGVTAESGPHGKGALPRGQYTVKPAVVLESCEKTQPYTDGKGLAWFAKLKPTFKTDRTGLGVHPDGNVPGTLGCIGIQARDTSMWKDQFDRDGVLYVI